MKCLWPVGGLATCATAVCLLSLACTGTTAGEAATGPSNVHGDPPEPLARMFRDPPPSARPSIYWLWLNGYVNRDYVGHELQQFRDAGVRGLCIFDMGARGRKTACPPAGPAFLSDASTEALAHAIRIAGRLNLEAELSVSSSWDMGGQWVAPRHASMGLYHTEIVVQGPAVLDRTLPLPAVPAKAPRRPDGQLAFLQDVVVLAAAADRRLAGHDFVWKLDPPGVHLLDHAVLYNTTSGDADRYGPKHLFAKDFTLAVSETPPDSDGFCEVLRASLQPTAAAQRFDFPPSRARYVRLRILNGHNRRFDRIELGELEVYSRQGINVVASHRANRRRDGAKLLNVVSELGHDRQWTAHNINDGVKSGPSGSWSSAGPPPLRIENSDAIVNLSSNVDQNGRLHWTVPPGKWVVMRFVCANTGEMLKVPSPNSDGLATDHLSREATETFLTHVIQRLAGQLGDFRQTALKRLYLASYEVRGPIWTPDFLTEFQRRRGYDMTPYLPALTGAIIQSRPRTYRFLYDFRKTLGDVLVDNYYRAARDVAHRAGLGIEAEAGGPGPPVHQVPVDALKALGSVDAMRGEFWPKRPDADSMWVVKETACAAHIYGHRRVHMEAFTSMHHWQDGPQDLKPAADRAFCEGANHMVWHTSSHLPPEAGKPGWVYGAGTHLNANLIWWPMARPLLDYLARCSYLLQQGWFVGDVCYYYGDQGYNFVPAKHVDPSLGSGYDYDVVNAEVIRTRMNVRDGRLVLPDGMSYQLLVLPEREDIDLAVLRKIETLVRAGATVVGPKPTRTNGLTGYPRRDEQVRQLADRLWGPCDGQAVTEHACGQGRVVWGRSLRQLLQQRGLGPDFQFSGSDSDADLDYIHRRTDQADIYFVQNRRAEWVQVDATFRVRGRSPELWLPDTGQVRKQYVYDVVDGGIRLPLRLAPEGSVFVVFRKPIDKFQVRLSQDPIGQPTVPGEQKAGPWPAVQVVGSNDQQVRAMVFQNGAYTFQLPEGRGARLRVDQLPAARELDGPWRVQFPPDRGAPESAVFDKLISWTDRPEAGIKYFSGIARYQCRMEIPSDWLGRGRKVFLDLGRLWAVGKVYVNGESLGTVWKAPLRVDITQVARPGSNRLEVEIANTWSNRLAGDARSPGGPHFGHTNIASTAGKSWATTGLLPSGLLGPVTLVPAVIRDAPLTRP